MKTQQIPIEWAETIQKMEQERKFIVHLNDMGYDAKYSKGVDNLYLVLSHKLFKGMDCTLVLDDGHVTTLHHDWVKTVSWTVFTKPVGYDELIAGLKRYMRQVIDEATGLLSAYTYEPMTIKDYMNNK